MSYHEVISSREQVKGISFRLGGVTAPILIQGEKGTGKEELAREIHRASARRNQPFTKIPCARTCTELIEIELFGCLKGAFLGASMDRAGKLEIANGGTLFLDEVGRMTSLEQTQLLRFLEEGSFFKLGGEARTVCDVRILASTSEDLEAAASEGCFCRDLYRHLASVQVYATPLRERREEIPELCEFYLRGIAEENGNAANSIPEGLLTDFLAYDWPGNLVELKEVVKRFALLKNKASVRRNMKLRLEAQQRKTETGRARGSDCVGLEFANDSKKLSRQAVFAVEKSTIETVLRNVGWNHFKAAEELHVSYETLEHKIKTYHL